jgi:hypothetical protein
MNRAIDNGREPAYKSRSPRIHQERNGFSVVVVVVVAVVVAVVSVVLTPAWRFTFTLRQVKDGSDKYFSKSSRSRARASLHDKGRPCGLLSAMLSLGLEFELSQLSLQ